MQKYKMPISRLRMMVCLIGMLLPMCIFAQQITVQGVVKDQTGETVIGASVMEKGTTNGTITGIDGDFSLNMSSNGTLVVSFVGYKTQEVQVKGQKQLQVVLSEDAEMLDEVVVIGYGTMKKSDLTGAVSSIGNKDIKDSPVSNLGQAIQGKISGVQIVDAGKPGDNVSIKIRGLGSINNCDPLVVIDGVPTDLGLSSLNMADVERLDVLKDASATAIYGSRGANGVVMITTKRGTEGKGKLAVSANYSFQNATNVPSLLNAAQYAELSNDMMVNSGRNPNPEWANPSELGAGTDWMDELLRTGVMQNYTVSYSGGNEKSHYYVSGGFLDQSGIVKSVNYRRFTFQSNSDAQVLKWLKFSNNITFSADTKKSGSYNIGDALKALPIYPVKNEDGSWSGPDGNSEWYGSTRNPIGPTELNKSQTDGYNFLANLTAELTFTKWLKFKSTFGYDAKFWFIDNFTPKYNWKPTPTEETSRYKSDNKSFTYLWDNYFLFDHTFAEKHRVGLMAGMSAQWNTNDYLNAQKNVFMFDNVHEMDNGEEMYAIGGNETEWALLSYMARVNYSYEDRYLLTATIRRDGSSRFGKKHRWGTFPSVSVAWRASQEKWFPKNDYINDLKVRAGYGVTGSQASVGNYSYLASYNTSVYPFGISSGNQTGVNLADNWVSSGSALWFIRESRFLSNSRMILGSSCHVGGTGFMFSREVMKRNKGWKFHLLTEDLEFTMDSILHGDRIGYCGTAILYDEQPVTFSQSWRQRLRWSKGFLQVFRYYGSALLKRAVRERDFSCIDFTLMLCPFTVLGVIRAVMGLLFAACGFVSWSSQLQSLAGWSSGIITSVLGLMALAALTIIVEHDQIGATNKELLAYVLSFPIYMLSYVPISFQAIFAKAQWKPIAHKG